MEALKEKYIEFYNLAREILGDKLIPTLNRIEILSFVSMNNWLIIPTHAEVDKDQSINRPDPNIYFRINDSETTMEIGLVYNTITSIKKLSNITLPFHETERMELISKLKLLDDRFTVTVYRKIYRYSPRQRPEYEGVKEWQSNSISENVLKEILYCSRDIRREGLVLKEKKKWIPIRPSVSLASVKIKLDKDEFIKVVKELKPIYELVLRIKTDKEIKEIEEESKKKGEEQKQANYREFVEDLKGKGVSGEEYRRQTEEWRKSHQ
jgi:hypothetical protein